MGAKWQSEKEAITHIYRDAAFLRHIFITLGTFLPGADVLSMMQKAPQVCSSYAKLDLFRKSWKCYGRSFVL